MAELLAPAGSYESLTAAVNAGADAVYMGGRLFGARAYAKNPDEEQLIRGVEYCHLHGRKFYLTVNTLLKEKELRKTLYDFLSPYYEAGIDGVIVQDPGVLLALGNWFPDLPLHASTQMSVTSLEGAKFLKQKGVVRIVPARELSLEEIRRIIDETGMEVETFVHGAMCFSYSGRCLFSSLLGGRSGNRGRCAQPCRLPYTLSGMGKTDFGYLLSMKDLCALEMLPSLLKAGIASFKIEGRMKSPEYTAGVVSVYRKYLDLAGKTGEASLKVSKEDQRMLMDLYNRGGFSQGYYRIPNGPSMIFPQRPNHYGTRAAQTVSGRGNRGRKELYGKALEPLFKGDVLEAGREKPGAAKEFTLGKDVAAGECFLLPSFCGAREGGVLYRTKCEKRKRELFQNFCCGEIKEKIKGELRILPDSPAILEVSLGGQTVRAQGQAPEAAQKNPLTKEGLLRQFSRTGNTPFVWEKLEIVLGENLFLTVQAQNELRRKALEELKARLLAVGRRPGRAGAKYAFSFSDGNDKRKERPKLTVAVSETTQLEAVLESADAGEAKVSGVYLDAMALFGEVGEEKGWSALENWLKAVRERGMEGYLLFPPVFREAAGRFFQRAFQNGLLHKADGCVVHSMDELGFLRNRQYEKTIVSDGGLSAFNTAAAAFYKENGVGRITLSPELNEKELAELSLKESELVVYGYQPLMVTAQCLRKNAGGCTGKPGLLWLQDRKKVRFPVKNRCLECGNLIYNSVPLQLGGLGKELLATGAEYFRLEFTIESREETGKILRQYAKLPDGSGEEPDQEAYPGTRGHFKRGVE